MNPKKYGGVIIPLVTPFTRGGLIDEAAVEIIARHVVDAGAIPFALGTTGESASIAEEQRRVLVKQLAAATGDNTIIYAGISSPSFQTSVTEAKTWADLGVSALVAHPPAYYPLSDYQLLTYFQKLADAVPLPLILYNIPAVTHTSIPLEVADQLSHHPNIVGIKDSERDMLRFNRSLEMWKDREDFVHLVGWGAQMAYGLENGSAGIVPSAGNLTPGLYVQLYQAALSGNNERVQQFQTLTMQVADLYQQGRNLSGSLAALKVLMNELDLCESEVLPPLAPLPEDEERTLRAAFQRFRTEVDIFS